MVQTFESLKMPERFVHMQKLETLLCATLYYVLLVLALHPSHMIHFNPVAAVVVQASFLASQLIQTVNRDHPKTRYTQKIWIDTLTVHQPLTLSLTMTTHSSTGTS